MRVCFTLLYYGTVDGINLRSEVLAIKYTTEITGVVLSGGRTGCSSSRGAAAARIAETDEGGKQRAYNMYLYTSISLSNIKPVECTRIHGDFWNFLAKQYGRGVVIVVGWDTVQFPSSASSSTFS